jgi:H+/Cl- antiporter ClcA
MDLMLQKNRRFRSGRYLFRKVQRKIHHRRLQKSTLTAIPYWIAALAVGTVAVGYANLFRMAEGWITDIYKAHPTSAFIGAPLAFFISALLVTRLAPGASGSGIPQTLAASEIAVTPQAGLIDRLLGLRVLVVKIVSSFVCILGGGAIGREGPTIQLAGSTFYLVHRILRKFSNRHFSAASLQSMIIAGGAAGLAAAFNTPLGGIVYAIEELAHEHLSFFRTSLIQAVIVSGLVAQLLLGPYLYLGYPDVVTPELTEIPWMIVVGVVVGLCGAFAGRALYEVGRWRNSSPSRKRQSMIAIGCGLLFALLIYLTGPVAVGSGKETIMDLLFTKGSAGDWTWPIARVVGNYLAYAAGCAGGIFAPALATGATLGSLFSKVFISLDPHLLVLMGMTAFLTGVTRTPFTSFVLVLEMTNRHSVIFAMMIAAMGANAAASLVEGSSLYEKVKADYLKSFALQAQSSSHS